MKTAQFFILLIRETALTTTDTAASAALTASVLALGITADVLSACLYRHAHTPLDVVVTVCAPLALVLSLHASRLRPINFTTTVLGVDDLSSPPIATPPPSRGPGPTGLLWPALPPELPGPFLTTLRPLSLMSSACPRRRPSRRHRHAASWRDLRFGSRTPLRLALPPPPGPGRAEEYESDEDEAYADAVQVAMTSTVFAPNLKRTITTSGACASTTKPLVTVDFVVPLFTSFGP